MGKRLDTLRRTFIWQGNKYKRFSSGQLKGSFLAREGGMGIRDMRKHNTNLVAKWLWRYICEERKYSHESDWCTKKVNPYLA